MFCSKCGKENNKDSKFCNGCGNKFAIQQTEPNLGLNQKNFGKIKKLNLACAIFNFILATFFGCSAFYILFLIIGLITYSGSGGSGLIILVMPFALILAIGYLFLGIFNIKINKKMNISSIETISIIEICVGVFLQGISFPTLIISIFRMILLSKIKKNYFN